MKAKRGNAYVRKRAERIAKLLTDNGEPESTQIVDLLVDIRHYAFTRKLLWFPLLNSANTHAATEQDARYKG